MSNMMEKEESKWEVCVRCYTYNHAPYITDAMNGFTMQQTDFPFVCCIVDDASTDGEQDVIKKYLDVNFDFDKSGHGQLYEKKMDYGTLIFTRHKTNHNCYFAVLLLNKNHYGTPELKKLKRSYISEWENSSEYEALCEGDDYWTDPLKLQKQVDFLEIHPDYGMCYTKVKRYIEKAKCVKEIWGGENTSFAQLIKKNTIPTLTVLIKSDIYRLYNSQIKPENHNWKMGDYPIWLYCAHESKVGFLDITTGVYRVLENSASHHKNYLSQLEFSLSGNSILSFFLHYFNEDIKERDFVDFHISYIEMRIALLKEENGNKAIKTFRKAFRSSFQWWEKHPLMIGWYMIPRILSEIARIRYRMLH